MNQLFELTCCEPVTLRNRNQTEQRFADVKPISLARC
jgi:hypothetical protein